MSNDVAYKNSGKERARHEGERMSDAVGAHSDNAQLARKLVAEAHHGTAAEQLEFWRGMHIGNGANGSNAFLPQGFTIEGKDDHHIVKDKQGKVIFNEEATEKKASKDAQIHAGEGPVSALMRQGMTYQEALKAAKDVKSTAGNGVFREGDSMKQDSEGLGDWHRSDPQREERKGEQSIEGRQKRLNEGYDAGMKILDSKTPPVLKNGEHVTEGGSASGFDGQTRLTADRIDTVLKNPTISPEIRKALTYMQQNFKDMVPEGDKDRKNAAITVESLRNWYNKSTNENRV